MCFQEVKIFAGKQTLFKYTVIKFVAVRKGVVVTVRCTVDDADSASKFSVRTITIVDVRWLKCWIAESGNVGLHVIWSVFWRVKRVV